MIKYLGSKRLLVGVLGIEPPAARGGQLVPMAVVQGPERDLVAGPGASDEGIVDLVRLRPHGGEAYAARNLRTTPQHPPTSPVWRS